MLDKNSQLGSPVEATFNTWPSSPTGNLVGALPL